MIRDEGIAREKASQVDVASLKEQLGDEEEKGWICKGIHHICVLHQYVN